jgi:hypothetical protein
MLERFDSSGRRFIMGLPFMDSFSPSDVKRCSYYARRCNLTKLLDGNARLPLNVAPELFQRIPVRRYQKLSKELGVDINFCVPYFPYKDPVDTKEKLAPVHVFTSFNHNGFSVAGPWFPSLGHPVMTSNLFTDEIKTSFVQESVYAMRSFFDVIVIAVPQRTDGSGTDSIFTDDFLRGTAIGLPQWKDTTFYVFEGDTLEGDDSLKKLPDVMDAKFFTILHKIEGCRRKNFQQYKEKQARKGIPLGYTFDMGRYLRRVVNAN